MEISWEKFCGSQLDEWAQADLAEPGAGATASTTLLSQSANLLPLAHRLYFSLVLFPLSSLPPTPTVSLSNLLLNPDCHNLQSHRCTGLRHSLLLPGARTDLHKISHTKTLFLFCGAWGAKHTNTGKLQSGLRPPYSMLSNVPFLINWRGLFWKVASSKSKTCATVASCSILN